MQRTEESVRSGHKTPICVYRFNSGQPERAKTGEAISKERAATDTVKLSFNFSHTTGHDRIVYVSRKAKPWDTQNRRKSVCDPSGLGAGAMFSKVEPWSNKIQNWTRGGGAEENQHTFPPW